MIRSALIGCLALLAGCATADRVQELEDRLAEAEAKLASLQAAPAAQGGNAAAAAAEDPREEAAGAMYEEIAALINDGRMTEAQAKIGQMEEQFADTRAWRRARKTAQELAVIGKEAPDSLSIDQWFQGEGEVNISADQPTLIVFFEEWCPHCKREVPKMQATYERFQGRGLQVIGLTKVTRRSTVETVASFIEEQNVGYPIAKEDGSVSQYFNVSGIPAAAVVKDGQIVWRGHPARLNDEMIEGWL